MKHAIILTAGYAVAHYHLLHSLAEKTITFSLTLRPRLSLFLFSLSFSSLLLFSSTLGGFLPSAAFWASRGHRRVIFLCLFNGPMSIGISRISSGKPPFICCLSDTLESHSRHNTYSYFHGFPPTIPQTMDAHTATRIGDCRQHRPQKRSKPALLCVGMIRSVPDPLR